MTNQLDETVEPYVEPKKKRRIRWWMVALGIVGTFVLFVSGVILWLIVGFYTPPVDYDKVDRTGSWSQINQDIVKPEGWQRFVFETSFTLGETFPGSVWYDENGRQQEYIWQRFGTYPRIDGSTVAVPMAVEFAWQHLDLNDDDANGFVAFNTTHDAYVNLIEGDEWTFAGGIRSQNVSMDNKHQADIIIVTEPSEGELLLAKEHMTDLVVEPVAFDAFVFITHIDNPVDSLTLNEIRDIYSGKITNWNEVGGNDSPIVPYQREENSGSQTAMLNLVMKDTPMLPPETIEISMAMGELIDAVAEYQNESPSIGYSFKYYIDNLYKDDRIKVLAIEGIKPTDASIRSTSYPLTSNYYGVIRERDRENVGGRFLDWMLSDEGQACIKQAGYISLR
jgi:phosphate transport system substrate-binding protein